ncbi:MAG: carbamoyltransferase [Deltaproteobacteria bacterium]|nr:carbamoyltransferase [Deltaproteobacteria bacterium]
MYIIGIHYSGLTASAALIRDGHLVAACPEERLDRQHYSRGFPVRAIRYCLDAAGITFEKVDALAMGFNPGINVAARFRGGLSERVPYPGHWLYAIPNQVFNRLHPAQVRHTEQVFRLDGSKSFDVHYLTHHDCHAAMAYYGSPFERAAILTVDQYGENTCTSWKTGEGNRIETLRDMAFPNTLGGFYSALTQFLGYNPDADEWKVMGMSAYGDPKRFAEAFRKLYTLREEGQYQLNYEYLNHYNFESGKMYGEKFRELFGEPRRGDDDLEQKHYDIAAGAQHAFEELLFHCLRHLHEVTRCPNLCLSGGALMNSVANGAVLRNTPFQNLFVPFSPDDTGNCIGSALQLYYGVLGHPRQAIDLSHSYWGPGYSQQEIESTLKKYGIPYRTSTNACEETAVLLAEGHVVGWFQGRMEFGQRALGNRSILADPRDPKMKEKINAAVKYREPYRPFAPSILEEHVREYFDIEPQTLVPFMEKVYPILPEKRAVIPAVTHNDGSGRLQTVSKKTNPLYHALLSAFEKKTGVPVVLNTSFNVKGEPIVCSPTDAIRTFYTSGLTTLVMGNCIIRK